MCLCFSFFSPFELHYVTFLSDWFIFVHVADDLIKGSGKVRKDLRAVAASGTLGRTEQCLITNSCGRSAAEPGSISCISGFPR